MRGEPALIMGDLHAIEDAGARPVPGMGLARARTGPAEETWVLQSDAAARTGFSVSAIRKWRRMGLVAERKVTSATGLERVEVKLEDALARAARQPERRRPETAVDASASPGSVVIAVSDLEGLFERMVEAERRADVAEAELQSVQARARFTFGQLAELRRQLQTKPAPPTVALRSADPSPLRAPNVEGSLHPPAAAAPPPAALRPPAPAPPRAAPPRPSAPAVQPTEPAPQIAANRTGAAEPRPSPAPSIEEVFGRLQRIYGRLDEYRREATISPATERQRQRELSEYDRLLVAVCDALDMPTGSDGGRPLSIEKRAALTRALARAGLDVRAGVQGAQPRGRFRLPGPRPQ